MAWRSGLASPPTQCRDGSRRYRRGSRRGPHALTKLFGKRRQRSLVHAERPQAVPGERDGHPARIERTADRRATAGADPVDDAGQPGPSLSRPPEAEEPVARRQRARPGQEEVLNVVEFEHRVHPRAGASSLHLVEHRRERLLQRQRLLDFARLTRTDIRRTRGSSGTDARGRT